MILRLSITAFVLTGETTHAVQALQGDRQFARCQIIAHGGGIEAATSFLAENATPDLLIVEVDRSEAELFAALEALAEVFDPSSKLLLIGDTNDIRLYRDLVGMGINEYLCGPIDADQLRGAIDGLYAAPDAAKLGRVIAFIGARGGVGSSSLAANTAYALGQMYGEEVILIDLDLSFGTAALSLNLQQRQSIADALAQPNRLDDVMMERFMLKYDDHLSVVPAPTILGGDHEVSVEAFEVLLDIVRRMASFVVLDVPHQWSPWVSEVLLDANEVVVTAYPDLANLRDAKNIFDTLSQKRGVDAPVRLVFNRVGASKGSELSAGDFAEPVKTAPAMSIPFEASVFGLAMNNGQSIVEVNKRSKSARMINQLASTVSARMPLAKDRKKSGGLSFFRSAK